jgi:hypothetical protein
LGGLYPRLSSKRSQLEHCESGAAVEIVPFPSLLPAFQTADALCLMQAVPNLKATIKKECSAAGGYFLIKF